ncbi:hypothetical protein AQBE111736_13785 [Aquirufa beregesia]
MVGKWILGRLGTEINFIEVLIKYILNSMLSNWKIYKTFL